MVWDALLANDLKECDESINHEKFQNFNLNMLDYVCVAMLKYVRQEILTKDYAGCLRRLLKYPPLETPQTIIEMALQIKDIIYKKVYQTKENKNIIKDPLKDSCSTSSSSTEEKSPIKRKQTTEDVDQKLILKLMIQKYKMQIDEKDYKEINQIIDNI